jgi:hypothetical protein
MNRKDLPPNFVEDVGHILSSHIGLICAIRLSEIRVRLCQLSSIYLKANDKDVRSAIAILREDGALICSLGSDSDGYYTAGNLAEYLEFKDFYTAYAKTIFTRVQKMDREARNRWGGDAQPALF